MNPFSKITDNKWQFASGKNARLDERLSGMPRRLEDIVDRIVQGLATSADAIYADRVVKEGKEAIKSLFSFPR